MSAPTRRQAFSLAGRLAAGITVFASMPACAFNPLPALPTRGLPDAAGRVAWLQQLPDGQVRLFLPRQELGQGISTALRQIVAEELGLPLEQVEVVLPTTDQIEPVRATVGSDSMKEFALPVARAAALLREHRHVHPDTDPIEIVDRGQPVALHSMEPGRQHRSVGSAVPTDRIADIVTGRPLYAADRRVPDMLYGCVAEAAPSSAPAGLQVLPLSDGRYGLLSEHPAPLYAAAENLNAAEASRSMPPVDIDALLSAGKLEHRLRSDRIASDAGWTIDRRYDIPFAAHAQIEPRSAVAIWHEGGSPTLELWTGTQDVFFVRGTLARHFGLAEKEVLVQSCRVGGGFGSRTIIRQELDAALLARAAGRPVKVQWSRADEFRRGFHRPPSSHRIRARLGPDGRIAEWWHAFCSGHVIFTSAAMPRWMQAVTGFVNDPGVARGAVPPYAARQTRIEFSDIRLPVDTGPWRGLGAGPNCYAIESAIDELAAAAGRDPVSFRLDNLAPEHARLAACIRRVMEMAGWDARQKSDPGFGRGIACGIYKEMSYVAAIADVEFATDGSARVSHIWCAQDCGMVVNPDQVRAQIEGNLVWGIGMVLVENLPIEDGRPAAYNFSDYPLPTMETMPKIDIDLIEPPGAAPSGAGETAIVVAAAIGNAIAAITGQRLTSLPYRPGTRTDGGQ